MITGFNANESSVLRVLADATFPLHLGVLATKSFPTLADDKANSWVRNSVRKPLKRGLISKIADGTYKITAQGRKALEEGSKSS